VIRLLDREVDFVSIGSMTAVSAALSRKWAELVEHRFGFRRSAFTGNRGEPIAVAGGCQIRHRCHPDETQERIEAWRARAISSWIATST
jgi:hypothetical protein